MMDRPLPSRIETALSGLTASIAASAFCLIVMPAAAGLIRWIWP